MPAELASECMEIITMAVDKHQVSKNYEVRKMIVTANYKF
jgi:hypothetical protein